MEPSAANAGCGLTEKPTSSVDFSVGSVLARLLTLPSSATKKTPKSGENSGQLGKRISRLER
jgi:hypothetical protein